MNDVERQDSDAITFPMTSPAPSACSTVLHEMKNSLSAGAIIWGATS